MASNRADIYVHACGCGLLLECPGTGPRAADAAVRWLVACEDHLPKTLRAPYVAHLETVAADLDHVPLVIRGQHLNGRDRDRPIPLVLHCPECYAQHIDATDPEKGWTNPPHRSHACHFCGAIWRPADVPTVGVTDTRTRGRNDTWPPVSTT